MKASFTSQALLTRLAPFGAVPRYWVAYSGGLDSSVLLEALVQLRPHLPGTATPNRIQAVHVDHGLHPDSPVWSEHCAVHCAALAVPLHRERLTTTPAAGESVEAWARAARYALFQRLLAPGEILLTAHQRDDQAETLLLALLRGSGPHGLAAMPVAAPLGAGQLVRPLLDFDRQTLADYAAQQDLTWRDDPSNAHITFDRNYLRHQIMPLLRARWPAASATLARSARHCADAAAWIDQQADLALATVRGEPPGALALTPLAQLDRPLRKAVVRRWLTERGFRPPETQILDRVLDELPTARADANPCVSWTGCEVRRYRGALFALAPLPRPPSPALSLIWDINGAASVLELPPGFGRLECVQCPDAVQMQMQIRFGQLGHSCRTSAKRPRHSLKQCFQAAGIPVWLRAHLPLLFQDEQLLAIAGVSACHGAVAGNEVNVTLVWSGFDWAADWPQLGRPLEQWVRVASRSE